MTGSSSTTKRPFRWGSRTRKWILVTHVAAAGSWLGIDVVMAVMIFTATITKDEAKKVLTLQSLELFAIWPLIIVGLLSLVTGVLLAIGSKYGLLKFWWVVVKLALNVLLSVLVVIALKPGVELIADQAGQFAARVRDTLEVGQLIYPPIVSPALLLVALLLSVFKPWGRIRRTDRSTPRRTPARQRRP